MQTNLEEAKAQEVAKLQNSLKEMQNKNDETNALLVKERENVKKVVEEAPPVIQETQVIVEDTQKVEALTAEVENLKVRKFNLTWLTLLPGVILLSAIFWYLNHDNSTVSIYCSLLIFIEGYIVQLLCLVFNFWLVYRNRILNSL